MMQRSKFRIFVIKFFEFIWLALSFAIPKNSNQILINSFPDFDDTTKAFLKVTEASHISLIILTNKKIPTLPHWLVGLNITLKYKYSLGGIWLFHRTKFIFFTHGLFSFWRTSKQHTTVNLWHGMPIKNIGVLDGKDKTEIPFFDFTIAYNEFFSKIIATSFDVEPAKVLTYPHPRIDCLFEHASISSLELPAHTHLAVWLPTYRSSAVGDIRVDGHESGNIFSGNIDLSELNTVFKMNDCICLVKPHPMQKIESDIYSQYSNIRYIDEGTISKSGISLYNLLAKSSFLITDISSVYFDYLFTKKPVAIFFPDLLEYSASRGFVSAIENLLIHEIICDKSEFASYLSGIFDQCGTTGTAPPLCVTHGLLAQFGIVNPTNDAVG